MNNTLISDLTKKKSTRKRKVFMVATIVLIGIVGIVAVFWQPTNITIEIVINESYDYEDPNT